MTCKARYRGLNPVFGVDKKETYTLDIGTMKCTQGDRYMWVRINELPAYLMPYESMIALLTEWDFAVGSGTEYVDHLTLADAWMSVYTPSEVIA